MPKVESLSWSLVFPKASTATPLSGSVAPLTGLEGRSMGLSSGRSKLWLVANTVSLPLGLGWTPCGTQTGQVECCTHYWCWLPQSWQGPSYHVDHWCTVREQSCFLCLGLMVKPEEWEPNWGAASRDVWHGESWRRQSASSMCLGCLWMLWPESPSNSGVVSSTGTSAPGCTTVVSVSLTEHMGTAPGLAAVKRNLGRSLTKLAWLTWERTSLNVVSTCSAILAHWSSCFLAIMAHWSSCFLAIPAC